MAGQALLHGQPPCHQGAKVRTRLGELRRMIDPDRNRVRWESGRVGDLRHDVKRGASEAQIDGRVAGDRLVTDAIALLAALVRTGSWLRMRRGLIRFIAAANGELRITTADEERSKHRNKSESKSAHGMVTVSGATVRCQAGHPVGIHPE